MAAPVIGVVTPLCPVTDEQGRPDPPVSRRGSRDADRLWCALILLIAVSAYLPTVGHEFVFDDDIVIVRNSYVRSLSHLPDILSTTEWAGGGLENHLYRPLTTITYALNYQISGLQPWSYHLVNVLLHAVVALLVYGLGRHWRLPSTAAGLGGLIFALHPLHVEAVASIVGRRDLLVAAFTLIMVLAHGRASSRGGRLAWPLLAYPAAMLSKETGVVGIGLVLLHDWLLPEQDGHPGGRRRLGVLYAGYAAALLGYLVIRRTVTGGLGIATIPFIDNPLAHAALLERWLTAVALIGRGLVLHIAPFPLSPDYSYNAIPLVVSPLDVRFAAAFLTIAVAGSLAFTRRRATPLFLVAAGFYLLPLMPGANLLFPVGTIFGERLLYLPSAAAALTAGWALATLTRVVRLRTVLLLAALLLFPLGAVTVRYSRAWHDDLSLFTAAVRSVPASTKAHSNLADALLDAERMSEAITEAQRAIDIAPDNFRALGVMGEAYHKLGRYDDAERSLRRALQIEPGYADALYVFGQVRRDQGDLAGAGRLWRQALQSSPNHAGALSDLGTLAFLSGDNEQARRYSERAVVIDPRQANAWYNLGLLYESAGDMVRSREAFDEFLRVAGPEYAEQIEAIRRKLGGR